MKALTIKQPWAALIAAGYKTMEVRSWKTDYRGPIAIHAGMSFDENALPVILDHATRHGVMDMHLPLCSVDVGAVVAVAELATVKALYGHGYHKAALCDYDIDGGQYGWVLNCVRPLVRPVVCRGAQRLWELSERQVEAVNRRLGAGATA